jgi:hypothetical protein
MVRNQANDQEIVSEGQHQERRIENPQDEWAEIANVKQKMQKRGEPMRHE